MHLHTEAFKYKNKNVFLDFFLVLLNFVFFGMFFCRLRLVLAAGKATQFNLHILRWRIKTASRNQHTRAFHILICMSTPMHSLPGIFVCEISITPIIFMQDSDMHLLISK